MYFAICNLNHSFIVRGPFSSLSISDNDSKLAKRCNDVALYIMLSEIKINTKITLSIVDLPEGIIRDPHKEARGAQTHNHRTKLNGDEPLLLQPPRTALC